jgi:hypothetical protein
MAEQDSDFFDWQGGDWVAKEVVANIKSGHAQFIVNTGDVVWWGKQGSNPAQLLVSRAVPLPTSPISAVASMRRDKFVVRCHVARLPYSVTFPSATTAA